MDSLLIGSEIELLGGQPASTNPACAGAVFMLGQDFDLGAPQPTTDFVASLLLDGERPFGRRASNRTVTLPVTIQAPDRSTLAAAREVLEQAVDQPYWTLTWTREIDGSNPLPLVLDCFRANPTEPIYNTRFEKQGITLQLTLHFTALPYGRSDTQQQMAFASPVVSTQVPPPPPAPVVLDNFTTVNSTQVQQSGTHIVGPKSIFWDPINFAPSDPQGLEQFFTYKAALSSVLDLTSMVSIQKWIGLGSRYYYNFHHHAGRNRVRIDFTLTDNTGNSLSFSRANISLPITEDPNNPAFSKVTLAIPQNAIGSNGNPFDYAHVISYSFTITNRQSSPCLRHTSVYVDAITAYPSTQTANPVTRGNLYNVFGVIGTAPRMPASLQFQQAPSASTPTVINAVGAGTYTVPLGTVYLKVEVIGGGGAGASQTVSGEGGGGGGAEYARENIFPCKPGDVIPYVVATGGTSGLTPTDGGTSAFGPSPGNTLTVTAFGGKSATPNTITGALGGNNSTNSVHFPGGQGRTASGSVGGGGGSSGGNASPGLSPTGTTSVIFNTPGTNTWLCPAGITQVFVFVVGAGGSGAAGGFENGGGGGGGEQCGAFLNVTPGNNYSYTVGTGGSAVSGNDVNGQSGSGSSFSGDNGTLTANGGGGGRFSFSGGAGTGGQGTFSGLLGFVENTGGNGGPASPYSGGGGSSGGTLADGNAGDGYGNGGFAPTGGGSGGNGSGANSSNGHAGSAPGGGGGGTYSNATSGAGANGRVSISYPGGAPTNNGASAVAGGGAGGQGGGANNTPGSSGSQPGGAGGGADSAGSSVAGGNGGAGQIIVTPYVNASFNTLIVHRPAYGSANTFVPSIPINGGNGTTVTVPVPVANVNATFDGTYSVILTNNSWNTPANARTLSVTVTQYEYVGSQGYAQTTTPISIVPNTQVTNGITVLGNITLPLKAIPPGNTTAYFTVTLNDSNASDTFFDCLLLDTMGQTIIVNIAQQAVTTPGIPSSGGTVTNTTGFPVAVSITGGTVTNVSVAGVTVGASTGTYTVLAGQTISISYSSAPSWSWNAIEGYTTVYIDEPRPDIDLGYVSGSNAGRVSAVSIMDKCQVISGGPISFEPNDNVLFAYCLEGAPQIGVSYYPRWYFDRLQ